MKNRHLISLTLVASLPVFPMFGCGETEAPSPPPAGAPTAGPGMPGGPASEMPPMPTKVAPAAPGGDAGKSATKSAEDASKKEAAPAQPKLEGPASKS